MMEIQIGVAKINKYASSESGDTLEVIERPNGGLSVVLADGQRSGKSAKRISNMVVRKVIALLAEGVRDGAAARAASDYLFTHKSGKVMSTLNILSLDMESNTLVIARNNPIPALISQGGRVRKLDEESQPVGIYRDTKPVITEVEIAKSLFVVIFSDGLPYAGERNGKAMDIAKSFSKLIEKKASPQAMADTLMEEALALEDGRPGDDISVVVLGVMPMAEDLVRRMWVRLPLK
jgi:serine phosphatase RsbU (regulator of sigma subunit)